LRSSLELQNKLRWLCNDADVPFDERLIRYYHFMLRDTSPTWLRRARGDAISPAEAFVARLKAIRWRYRASRSLREALGPAGGSLDERFRRHWAQLLQPGRPMADYAQFPAFPNPHVRTNGFVMRRDRLLDMGFTAPPTKIAACAFESGAHGLTARLRAGGLRSVVVDRAGRAYDVPEWPRSATFRLARQEELLVTDKQTRAFAAMPDAEQATLRRLAWGDGLVPAPVDLPDLGLSFSVDEAGLAL
jgi:hypothetical protein